MKCIFVLRAVALLTSGWAVARPQFGMHLVAPLVDEGGPYAMDVTCDDKYVYHLQISCLGKCKTRILLDETMGFILQGGFVQGDQYVTIWSGASVTQVIIYRIHHGVATRVLDQPSRDLPEYDLTPDGRTVIVLHHDTPGMYIGKELFGNPPGLTQEERERIRRDATTGWVWDGRTYVPYHGEVVGYWQTIR